MKAALRLDNRVWRRGDEKIRNLDLLEKEKTSYLSQLSVNAASAASSLSLATSCSSSLPSAKASEIRQKEMKKTELTSGCRSSSKRAKRKQKGHPLSFLSLSLSSPPLLQPPSCSPHSPAPPLYYSPTVIPIPNLASLRRWSSSAESTRLTPTLSLSSSSAPTRPSVSTLPRRRHCRRT